MGTFSKEISTKKKSPTLKSFLEVLDKSKPYTKVPIVDSKKVGRIFGIKGATLKAIEERTKTQITLHIMGHEKYMLIVTPAETDDPRSLSAGLELLEKVGSHGPLPYNLPMTPEKSL